MNRGLAGKLSADATISGTVANPLVDGHVDIVNGAFQSYKYQSLKADLDYTGNRIGLDATLQQSPTEAITAKGSVPTTLFKKSSEGGHVAETAADRIDVHVQSTALNLGILQAFTTQLTDVAGTLEADVHVTGSGEDPHLQGHHRHQGGRLRRACGRHLLHGTEYADRSGAGKSPPAEVRDRGRGRAHA